MKKAISALILSLVSMLIFLQLVSGAEIFSGEVKDNVPFVIEGVTHVSRYYDAAKKASILAGTERVLVPVGGCADIGPLKYCVDSASGAFDDETGDPMGTAQLRVMQSGPEIDIDRDITDDEPNLGEEIEITATITNVGNERAVDVNYEDKFPFSAAVTSNFYTAATNGVLWAGSLDKNKSMVVKYRLKFKDFAKFNSTAEAKFVFNNKVNKVKSDTILIEVSKPYRMTETISSRSVDLNEEITYSVSINNTDAVQDVKVNKLDIVIPAGAVFSYRDMAFDTSGQTASYSGTVPALSSKNFTLKFKSSKAMQGDLITKSDLKVSSKLFSEGFTNRIAIGISDILPEITISPNPVTGGKELQIEAKITNFGENKVSGISVSLTSDLVDDKVFTNIELEAGKKHNAFNRIINAPAIDTETDYTVQLGGNYKNSAGKTVRFDAKDTVTVTPQEKVVEITPATSVSGKNVNITVSVKNLMPYKMTYVSLIDALPAGFRMSSGSRDADIEELGIGEEKTAYSYVITVPESFNKDSFDITTTFNALDSEEKKVMTEKKSTIKIGSLAAGTKAASGTGNSTTEVAGSANVSANASQEAATEAGGEESGKPGVFRRMWLWVKGIFVKDKPEEKFE
jgi:uncharacterized repeat protein (TIGR01451 family)